MYNCHVAQGDGQLGHERRVREYTGWHILAEDGLHQAGELHGVGGDHGSPVTLQQQTKLYREGIEEG